MRDAAIVGFMLACILVSFHRPWLATLTYLYADLLQPQRLSYYLLQGAPLNFWLAITAVLFFLFEKKRNLRFGAVQILLVLFTAWFTITSLNAQIQDWRVWFKWDAAWKAVLFAGVFMPFVLATRTRIEAVVGLMVACVALLTVNAGLKTLVSGGGYDELTMIVDTNRGLYESSTVSTVAIATIPLILYMLKHSQIVPRNRLMTLFAAALIASSFLVIIGTEARTGLICVAALALIYFRRAKRKLAVAVAAVAIGAVAIPLLPGSFTERMATIAAPSEEKSASTRTEVWQWAIDYVKEEPLGGGFGVNRLTVFKVRIPIKAADGGITGYKTFNQRGRAFHSSYFEVLAEHGYPGLALYLIIIGVTMAQLSTLRRRYANASPGDEWVRPLARALQRAIILYCVGGIFVGLSMQTTLYVLIGFSVALMHLTASQRTALALRSAPEQLRRRIDMRARLGGPVRTA